MKKGLFTAALLSLLFIHTQAAFSDYGQPLANGTFDTDLSGWTIASTNSDGVIYDQAAVLLNPGDFPLNPNWPFHEAIYDEDGKIVPGSLAFDFLEAFTDSTEPIYNNSDYSLISQDLILPSDADMISFEVTMEIYNRYLVLSETDKFTVTIYGPGSQEIFNLNAHKVQESVAEEPNNYLYDLMESDSLDGNDFATRHLGYRIFASCDISQWRNQNVTIEFKLDHDYSDGVRTTVTVDNVYISQKGDVTPPTVTIGEMMELWPPNHKYRTFYLSDCIQGISDDTDGQMDINKVGTILSIYSDELEDSTGKGDGNFLNDIIILGTSSFMVRAEREGTNNGRIYGVTFEAKDSSGNSTIATFYLGVPHDQSGTPPVDDGPASGYTVSAF
jgi:hypothetical protein